MRRIFAYATGSVALVIVLMALVSALIYACTNTMATLANLATSTLQGIGVAIGGVVGSALILRFKAARSFLRHTIEDIDPKSLKNLPTTIFKPEVKCKDKK